ncbi:MAG: hypothetical protein ABIS01_06315, partial [Ferruginibacter sp.]
MKVTTKVLIVILLLFTLGLFASNIFLKKEYEKIDKSDIYWTYEKILQQPFKHLVIEGGNITKIAYEQNKNASVGVFKGWNGYKNGAVKAFVKNDTLFLKVSNHYQDKYEKNWLNSNTMVRIFSPALLSVKGVDTRLEMFKLNQKSISVSMSGRSGFEVETVNTYFDSINITAKDSS